MKHSRRNPTTVPGRRLSAGDDRPSQLDTNAQWQRNRTLSGVRPRADLGASPRAQVHALAMRRQKVTGIFVLVLIAAALLALLITQLSARVVIAGSSTAITAPIDAPRYEKIINDYYGVNPASRLRFLLNEDSLSDYATAIAPEVAHITQRSAENVVETHFSVTFRKPIAGWQINNHQYYVDDQGIVFEKNYYAAPTVQIIDESGISPEQGTTVASGRFLSFVGRVVALGKESGLEVTQAILPSGTTRELEIALSSTPTKIRLSIDRGAGEQVEDMVRALNFLKGKGSTPGYIDVRVSGRAAYQ